MKLYTYVNQRTGKEFKKSIKGPCSDPDTNERLILKSDLVDKKKNENKLDN